jgi:putative membrane protein insertion efficiency factor
VPLSTASKKGPGAFFRKLKSLMATQRLLGLFSTALLLFIRSYQLLISPLLAGTGACRFVPSCSEYAQEAVRAHGAARGGWLALKRVARCHPCGGHGLDVVP